MAQVEVGGSRVLAYLDREVVDSLEDFQDPSQEWRRLFSELLGHVLPRARRRGRRDDGAGVPGHDQPHGRGRGTRV